jgi:hypothetical protein
VGDVGVEKWGREEREMSIVPKIFWGLWTAEVDVVGGSE